MQYSWEKFKTISNACHYSYVRHCQWNLKNGGNSLRLRDSIMRGVPQFTFGSAIYCHQAKTVGLVRFKSDPLVAFFLRFLLSAARVRSWCVWNQGVDCNAINGSYRGTMVKNHALTVNIFMTYEGISYSCVDHGIQKCTYIPTYNGNSLRKSRHNHRCNFGFTVVWVTRKNIYPMYSFERLNIPFHTFLKL